MDQSRLDRMRQQSTDALDKFQKAAMEALEASNRPLVLEVANGTPLLYPDATEFVDYRKAEPGDVESVLNGAKPDLLLVDGDDAESLEAYKAMKDTALSIVVIGRDVSVDGWGQITETVTHIVFKPVSPEALMRLIKTMLEQ